MTYSFDTEPKVLVVVPPGKPGWWSLDLIPGAEYAAKNWLDLMGEFDTSYTKQTDANNSVELAPRAGLREYGTLAQRYVREFDQKWVRGGAPADEPLVGSGDIQSLADLANSFEIVNGRRLVPFTWQTVL